MVDRGPQSRPILTAKANDGRTLTLVAFPDGDYAIVTDDGTVGLRRYREREIDVCVSDFLQRVRSPLRLD